MSLELLRKSILEAKKKSTVEKKPAVKPTTASTVESSKEKRVSRNGRESRKSRISSDDLRFIYKILTGKITRADNVTIAKMIIEILKNEFGI